MKSQTKHWMLPLLIMLLPAHSISCGFLSLSGAIINRRPLSLVEYTVISHKGEDYVLKIIHQQSIDSHSIIIPDTIEVKMYAAKLERSSRLIVSSYELCGKDRIHRNYDYGEIWRIKKDGTIIGTIAKGAKQKITLDGLIDSLPLWKARERCTKC